MCNKSREPHKHFNHTLVRGSFFIPTLTVDILGDIWPKELKLLLFLLYGS